MKTNYNFGDRCGRSDQHPIKRPFSRWPAHRGSALLESIFLILAAFCTSNWLATPAMAITRSWTHNSSEFWSDPDNWSPAGIPQTGDDLFFYDEVILSGPDPMINDLVGLSVRSLDFGAYDRSEVVTPDWVLNGNTLTLTGPIAADNASNNERIYINCGLIIDTNLQVIILGSSNGSDREMHLAGPIDLHGHTLSIINLGFSVLEVSGAISGNGDVVALGSHSRIDPGLKSIIVFSGTEGNTFNGAMTVTGRTIGNTSFTRFGHVILNKQSGLAVPGRLRVENGATVELGHSEQIADDAVVELTGVVKDYLQYAPRLMMDGYSETIGSLRLTNRFGDTNAVIVDTGGGTLTVNGTIISRSDSEQAVPAITGRLNLAAGSHNITTSGSAYAGLDIQAEVTGFGGFQKLGNSALLLEANNSFSGSISIDAGILDVRNNHALGDVSGDTSLFGGQLTLRNVAIGTERLSAEGVGLGGEMPGSLIFVAGSSSWAGQVLLDTNLVITGGDITFTGDISGIGGIGFFNLGTSILGGPLANTYTGTTLVRCSLLEFNKSPMFRAYGGPLVVGGGSGGPYEARWLQTFQAIVGPAVTLYANGVINLNNLNQDFGPVTFNGGLLETGTGLCKLYQPLTVNPASTTAVINGYLGLPPGADRVFIVGDGAADCDLLVNAVVFGSPGTYFVKQGAGTMCLTGLNTFNAPTLLEAGILDINRAAGLGTWPGLIIFDGATLRLSGSGIASGGVEVVGAGVGGTLGAVQALPGNFFTLSGNVLLDAASTFNVGTGGGLTLNGVVAGSGPLTKIGPGFLQLAGPANNTYSSNTVVSAGTLILGKSGSAISVPHKLVVGPAFASSPAVGRLAQTGGLGEPTVQVNANSLFDLNGYYTALTQLTLNDGGSVQTGVALLDFPSGGAINVGTLNAFTSHPGSAITGAIGLPANSPLSFNVSPITHFFPFANGPDLDVMAIIPRPTENVSFAPAGIVKNGLGWMRLGANNTYAGLTAVNAGKLDVDGTQPLSSVAVNSGTLGGSGTVGPLYMTTSSAVVAPGDNGPGILTCGNVNAGITASGVLRIEFNGTTPGSGYDQLNVVGTVNLAGVALERSLGFSPPTGAQFQIINNDGRDLVTGAFDGLPNGGKLYIGDVIYQINYRFGGRFGNDVALQGLGTPPPPTLIIQRLPPASVRLLWPVSDPPFNLQICTNLATANWTPALPAPTVSDTNNIVIHPTLNAQQFYRLISP